MAVTMARPFQRGRSPACDAFGERRHGSANNASTCSDDLREGHGRAEERPIILSWMGARFRDHWREIFPVSAAALFEEEVLIKAALNCNQELIVKLLGVIRASHAYTALGCSAACNNTLGPWFYFSNLGSDYFYYKSEQSELLVEEANCLLAAQWGHGPVSLPCMLSLPRKVVKTQEDAALTIQANLVLQHLRGHLWMSITNKYTDV